MEETRDRVTAREAMEAGFADFAATWPGPGPMTPGEREMMHLAFVAGGAYTLGRYMANTVDAYHALRSALVAMSGATASQLGRVEEEREPEAEA